MRYISGIEINKVRYIYLYLQTIAMMVIYHSDLYVLKDQIYILVNIQCNESRDIINLTIIIRSGPAVTWLRHTIMSPDTVRSVLQHSATPPPCVLVSGISGHLHTQGGDGGVAECRETLRNMSCDMSCDTVLARPGCRHPVLSVGQQQVKNKTWKLKARAM